MSEDDLIKALERVDRHGDVSLGDDPASYAMRARMEREHLARRDPYDDRLILTLDGRRRLVRHKTRSSEPARGVVTLFPRSPAGDGQRPKRNLDKES